MSPLRMASHWNHTPCTSCMEKHGLTEPKRTRPQSGPCCFCGGERSAELRGRAPEGVNCTLEEPAQPKLKRPSPGTPKFLEPIIPAPQVSVTVDVPVEPAASTAPKKSSIVRPTDTPIGKPKGRLQAVQPASAPVEEKPKKKAGPPMNNMSPEKQAEMEAEHAYARELIQYARSIIKKNDERGKNDMFSFVTVRRNEKYAYGEAGMHIHRKHGMWTGRPASTTHLPRRSLLITDRATREPVAMVTRWRCGGIAVFSKFTEMPNHKLCPPCVRSEEWNKDPLGNARAAQARGVQSRKRQQAVQEARKRSQA